MKNHSSMQYSNTYIINRYISLDWLTDKMSHTLDTCWVEFRLQFLKFKKIMFFSSYCITGKQIDRIDANKSEECSQENNVSPYR